MIEPLVLLAFLPASLALNLTPGADMMFCVGQGLRHGPRAAWQASAGISAAVLLHGLVAGLGLGAIVAASPWAWDAIRWAGAAYLLWLAAQALRATGPGGVPAVSPRPFREALVVNLTNPKVILFVLAFVPQFVDPGRSVLPQFLVLSAVIAAGGFVVNTVAGMLAGGAGRALGASARARRVGGWISAGIFGALALRLAVMERG